MTILEQKEKLCSYRGRSVCPEDFARFWSERWCVSNPKEIRRTPVQFKNPAAVYEELHIAVKNGRTIQARYIRPSGEGRFPTLLMFHDQDRGVRGWHHMTRFVASGYAVVALEREPLHMDWLCAPDPQMLEQCDTDALALVRAALLLPQTDAAHLVSWGEGFGGGLAIVAAAISDVEMRCAALHPLPADFRGCCDGVEEGLFPKLDYVDLANFAPMLKGELLLGTGLLDRIAPPAEQYAIYHRAVCPKRHLVYPKYEHERINFFENELLKFLSI